MSRTPGGGGIQAPAGDSIVLEEEIDPSYEPTNDEVLEYAKWLGMDPVEDHDLLYVAREGLKAPLPDNWKPCKTADTDEIYYFNFASGESTWDHPCDQYYKNLYSEAKKKKLASQQSSKEKKKKQKEKDDLKEILQGGDRGSVASLPKPDLASASSLGSSGGSGSLAPALKPVGAVKGIGSALKPLPLPTLGKPALGKGVGKIGDLRRAVETAGPSSGTDESDDDDKAGRKAGLKSAPASLTPDTVISNKPGFFEKSPLGTPLATTVGGPAPAGSVSEAEIAKMRDEYEKSMQRLQEDRDAELRRAKAAAAEETARVRSEANAELESARRARFSLEDDVRRLKNEVEDAKAEATALKRERESLQRNVTELEEGARRVAKVHEEESTRLRNQVRDAEARVVDARTAADEASVKLKRIHDEEVQRLEGELRDARRATAGGVAAGTLAELQAAVDAARKEAQSANAALNSVQSELVEAQNARDAAVSELKGKLKASDDSQAEIERLQTQLSDLRKQLEHSRESMEVSTSLASEREDWEQEKRQLKSQHADEVARLRVELTTSESAARRVQSELEDRVRRLNEELGDLQRATSGVSRDGNAELSAARDAWDAERKRLIAAHESEVGRLQNELDEAHRSASLAREKTQDDIVDLQRRHGEEVTRLRRELFDAQNKLLDTAVTVKYDDEAVKVVTRQLEAAKDEVAAMKAQRDTASSEISQLKLALDSKARELSNAQDDVRRLQQEVATATRQLESQSRAMETSGSEALNRFRAEADEELRRLRALHSEEIAKLRNDAMSAEAAARRSVQSLEDELRRAKMDVDAKQAQLTSSQREVEARVSEVTKIRQEWEVDRKRLQTGHDEAMMRVRQEITAAESRTSEAVSRADDELRRARISHDQDLAKVREQLLAAEARLSSERVKFESDLAAAKGNASDALSARTVELTELRTTLSEEKARSAAALDAAKREIALMQEEVKRVRAELDGATSMLEAKNRSLDSLGSDAVNRYRLEAEDELRRLKAAHHEEVAKYRSEQFATEAAARRAQSALEDEIRQLKLELEVKQRQLDAAVAAQPSDTVDSGKLARIQKEWEDAAKRVQSTHEAVLARLKSELQTVEQAARDAEMRHDAALKSAASNHAEEVATLKAEAFAAKSAWTLEKQALEEASRKVVSERDDEIRALKLELMVVKADSQAKPVTVASTTSRPGDVQSFLSPDRKRGGQAAIESEIARLQRELDANRPHVGVGEDDDREDASSSLSLGEVVARHHGHNLDFGDSEGGALSAYLEKETAMLKRAAEFTRKQRGTLAQRYKELRREKDAWKEGVDSLGLHSSDSRRKVLKEMKRSLDQQTDNLNREQMQLKTTEKWLKSRQHKLKQLRQAMVRLEETRSGAASPSDMSLSPLTDEPKEGTPQGGQPVHMFAAQGPPMFMPPPPPQPHYYPYPPPMYPAPQHDMYGYTAMPPAYAHFAPPPGAPVTPPHRQRRYHAHSDASQPPLSHSGSVMAMQPPRPSPRKAVDAVGQTMTKYYTEKLRDWESRQGQASNAFRQHADWLSGFRKRLDEQPLKRSSTGSASGRTKRHSEDHWSD